MTVGNVLKIQFPICIKLEYSIKFKYCRIIIITTDTSLIVTIMHNLCVKNIQNKWTAAAVTNAMM